MLEYIGIYNSRVGPVQTVTDCPVSWTIIVIVWSPLESDFYFYMAKSLSESGTWSQKT